MKNTHRATLYASLFLLTIVTFGNSSAMDQEKPQTLKHLTRDKQRPETIVTFGNNSAMETIVTFGNNSAMETIVTFGNSSAMDQREKPQTLKHLTLDKQRPDKGFLRRGLVAVGAVLSTPVVALLVWALSRTEPPIELVEPFFKKFQGAHL